MKTMIYGTSNKKFLFRLKTIINYNYLLAYKNDELINTTQVL